MYGSNEIRGPLLECRECLVRATVQLEGFWEHFMCRSGDFASRMRQAGDWR